MASRNPINKITGVLNTIIGNHDGPIDYPVLEDSTAWFLEDGVRNDMICDNISDISSGPVIATTEHALGVFLTGGTKNLWNPGDVYNINHSRTIQWDPNEGTLPPDDIKHAMPRPVLIQMRKQGADHTEFINDGSEPDELSFTGYMKNDDAYNDVMWLSHWYKHANSGIFTLTYYSDFYPDGVEVEITNFEIWELGKTGSRRYKYSITLVLKV